MAESSALNTHSVPNLALDSPWGACYCGPLTVFGPAPLHMMRFSCDGPVGRLFLPVCMAILVGLLSAPALAASMFEFKIQSPDDYYQSEITLGSGSNGAWRWRVVRPSGD